MDKKQPKLHLNRETVRELDAELRAVAGGAATGAGACQNLTIPVTLCQCTGTETATNICCIAQVN